MWDLVPWPRIELRIQPRPLALGAWSLSHWTTREVPAPDCIMSMLHCLDTYRMYIGKYVFLILVVAFKRWRILVSLEKWKVWTHMPPGPHPPGSEGCPLGPGVPLHFDSPAYTLLSVPPGCFTPVTLLGIWEFLGSSLGLDNPPISSTKDDFSSFQA